MSKTGGSPEVAKTSVCVCVCVCVYGAGGGAVCVCLLHRSAMHMNTYRICVLWCGVCPRKSTFSFSFILCLYLCIFCKVPFIASICSRILKG